MNNIASFLSTVAEERRGFKFGEPHRLEPDSLSVILPIIRKTTTKRQYVTLSEIENLIEIVDTGKINRVKIDNKSSENVFIRSGTLLRGKTQERATTRSSLIFPNKSVEIDVRCIHATKGIKSKESVTGRGFTPLSLDQLVYAGGYTPKDQHSFWAGVKSYSVSTRSLRTQTQPATANIPSAVPVLQPTQLVSWQHPFKSRPIVQYSAGPRDSSDNVYRTASLADVVQLQISTANMNCQTREDDLVSVIDEVCSGLDDNLLSKVALVTNQVGLAFINEKGCQCIELFDVPDSWSAIHKDAVRRVGAEAAKKDEANIFDFKPQYVVNAVSAILAQDFQQNLIFEHRPSNGEPPVKITGLTCDRFVGEVVEIDGRVMHLNIIKLAS